jgi:hypothetical protein
VFSLTVMIVMTFIKGQILDISKKEMRSLQDINEPVPLGLRLGLVAESLSVTDHDL